MENWSPQQHVFGRGRGIMQHRSDPQSRNQQQQTQIGITPAVELSTVDGSHSRSAADGVSGSGQESPAYPRSASQIFVGSSDQNKFEINSVSTTNVETKADPCVRHSPDKLVKSEDGGDSVKLVGGLNPIQKLKIIPFVPRNRNDERPKATEVLAEYANVYDGIELNYSAIALKPKRKGSDGPTLYKVSVKAGFRHGEGIGGTVAEAKQLAALACLKDLELFNPGFELVDLKEIVKLDPRKDILYILERTCKAYGLKKPVYQLGLSREPSHEFYYNCIIGNYVTEGVAEKKRVSIRIAAMNMYNLIRDNYNAGTLAISTYQD